MKERVISRSTWLVFALALVMTAVMWVVITFGIGGEQGTLIASDIGELLVVGLSAGAILWCATRLGATSAIGRPWLLIGIGALSYAIGDAIWAIIEVGQGLEVPYPGLPDLFYLVEYPLFAAGILLAGLAYRGLVPLRRPALIATATGVGLSAVIYFGLLQPYVLTVTDMSAGERALSILYPLGDVALMLAPAVFVIAVVAQLGGGRLAWPWWAVAIGTVAIAITDTAYAWLSAYDLYQSGSFIDYGWGVGHAFVMLGALIALDLARVHRR